MNRLPKIFLWVSLPLFILDQITKWWVVFKFADPVGNNFHTPDEKIEVIEGVLWWWRIHNQGVAFGMGNGSAWAPYVFLCVLVVALILITVFWKRKAFPNALSRFAAVLLVAGILGNLTDRIFQGFFLEQHAEKSFFTRLSKGYVVDFIDVKIPGYEKISPNSRGHWPTFNVADSCISVAALCLFISAFRPEDKKEGEES